MKKYGIGSCQKKHFASAQPLLITKYMMSLEKMGVEEGRVNKHKMDWTPDAGLYIAFMVSEIPKKKTWWTAAHWTTQDAWWKLLLVKVKHYTYDNAIIMEKDTVNAMKF